MRHAFLIIAHSNFDILEKQIELLNDERSDFYIHIDQKAKFDIDSFNSKFSNASINFVERKKIKWGDYSQIDCEYRLLKESTKKYHDYYHLISGVDMPLHTIDEMEKIILKKGNKEFIHFDSDSISESELNRIKYYQLIISRNKIWNFLNGIIVKFQKIIHINRLSKINIKPMKGCNWFSITNECANYIVSKEDKIQKMFAHSICGDEIFLQTLVFNSRFIENVSEHNFCDNYDCCLRYIDWKRGNPYIFRNEDFNELVRSDCLFARKFDYQLDPKIVDMITDYLLKKKGQ